MRAFDEWFIANEELLRREEISKATAEIIYEAGRLAERESVLDLIASGVLTVHQAETE